jgi:hypothetical protein
VAYWIHFLLQTAALVSGLASLFAVSLRGTRKEALRSIQMLAPDTAACSPSTATDSPFGSRSSVERPR